MIINQSLGGKAVNGTVVQKKVVPGETVKRGDFLVQGAAFRDDLLDVSASLSGTNQAGNTSCIALDESRVLLAYKNATDSKLYAVVHNINSDGTVSAGTPVEIANAVTGTLKALKLTGSLAVILWGDGSTTVRGRSLLISGNEITLASGGSFTDTTLGPVFDAVAIGDSHIAYACATGSYSTLKIIFRAVESSGSMLTEISETLSTTPYDSQKISLDCIPGNTYVYLLVCHSRGETDYKVNAIGVMFQKSNNTIVAVGTDTEVVGITNAAKAMKVVRTTGSNTFSLLWYNDASGQRMMMEQDVYLTMSSGLGITTNLQNARPVYDDFVPSTGNPFDAIYTGARLCAIFPYNTVSNGYLVAYQHVSKSGVPALGDLDIFYITGTSTEYYLSICRIDADRIYVVHSKSNSTSIITVGIYYPNAVRKAVAPSSISPRANGNLIGVAKQSGNGGDTIDVYT